MHLKLVVQPTPNPNALKYILSEDVKTQGKATYTDKTQAGDNVLAVKLFELEGVKELHFFENVITLTKQGTQSWEELNLLAQQCIVDNFASHNPNFAEPQNTAAASREDDAEMSPEMREISAILDRTIRPGLQMDGGDLDILSYKDKVLTIHYQGACGSCPSATSGTLMAIQDILRSEFDPEIEICPV